MKDNTFIIEVLEDGKISVKTAGFGKTKHIDADDFLDSLLTEMGGPVTTKENKKAKKQAQKAFFHKKKVVRGGKIIQA